jgi:hypothetical protein
VWRHSTLIIPSMISGSQSLILIKSFLILYSNQSAELALGIVDSSGETISLLISLRLDFDFCVCHVHERSTNNGN